MALTLARWPLAFPGRSPAAGARSDRAARPDRLLRANPVLLLPGLQSPESVARVVAEWNPQADPAGDGSAVADAVRWYGPIRLTPMLRADAGLTGSPETASCGLAYVAEVRRERVRVADGRQADVLRSRYPRGVPAGAEAEAWQLLRGLARRLRGVAQLPGCPPYAPFRDPRPLPGDTDRRVYSHEMLPWIVLREILRPLAPDLAREALPDGGYVLRQRGLLEVRVRPAGGGVATVPYALRERADDAWPHSVYEFCDLAEPASADRAGRADRPDRPDRADHRRPAPSALPVPPARPAEPPRPLATAAALIAEVTGGVLLDTDGFPVPIRATVAHRR